MKNDENEGLAMVGVKVRKKEERRRIKPDEDEMKIKAFYYRGHANRVFYYYRLCLQHMLQVQSFLLTFIMWDLTATILLWHVHLIVDVDK